MRLFHAKGIQVSGRQLSWNKEPMIQNITVAVCSNAF
jgi:hypothetical protein